MQFKLMLMREEKKEIVRRATKLELFHSLAIDFLWTRMSEWQNTLSQRLIFKLSREKSKSKRERENFSVVSFTRYSRNARLHNLYPSEKMNLFKVKYYDARENVTMNFTFGWKGEFERT